MMSASVPTVYIARTLLEDTARLLASFAAGAPGDALPEENDATDYDEGVVYWFGFELGERAVVTTLVVPDADTSGGSIHTSAAANAEALGAIIDTPLVLLGQAHSHPSRNVNHSWVDDRDTFAQFPNALSVVVPSFGRSGMTLAECGVYRHLEGQYRRISQARITEHLRVVPGLADYRKTRPNV